MAVFLARHAFFNISLAVTAAGENHRHQAAVARVASSDNRDLH
jgi:hypothetical protein